MPQIPGLLHVRNITKEELARMDPEERKKPYACESKSVDKIVIFLEPTLLTLMLKLT